MSDKVIGALNNGSPSKFTTTRNLKMAAIDMQRAYKNYNKTKDAERKTAFQSNQTQGKEPPNPTPGAIQL